jgi:hypothetical protein
MEQPKQVSSAEAYPLAQAQELIDAREEGRELPLDEDGKIVPSEQAFPKIHMKYIVSEG